MKELTLVLVMSAYGCIGTMDMASFEKEVLLHAGDTINYCEEIK